MYKLIKVLLYLYYVSLALLTFHFYILTEQAYSVGNVIIKAIGTLNEGTAINTLIYI